MRHFVSCSVDAALVPQSHAASEIGRAGYFTADGAAVSLAW